MSQKTQPTNDETTDKTNHQSSKEDQSSKDDFSYQIAEKNREAAGYRVKMNELQKKIDKMEQTEKLASMEDKAKLEVLNKDLEQKENQIKELEQYKLKVDQWEEKQKEKLREVVGKLSTEDQKILEASSAETEDKIKLASRLLGQESSSPQPGKASAGDKEKEKKLIEKYNQAIKEGTFEETSKVIQEMKENNISLPQ